MSRRGSGEFGIIDFLRDQSMSQDPLRYARVIRAMSSPDIIKLKDLLLALRAELERVDILATSFSKATKAIESDMFTKKKQSENIVMSSLEDQVGAAGRQDLNAVKVASYTLQGLKELLMTAIDGTELVVNSRAISGASARDTLTEKVKDVKDELGTDRVEALLNELVLGSGGDALRDLALEQQLNGGAVTSFSAGVATLSRVPGIYKNIMVNVENITSDYFEKLSHRHRVEGYGIACGSPVLTDLAIIVWENMDKTGEIKDGTEADKLSMYTVNRAHGVISAIATDFIGAYGMKSDFANYLTVEVGRVHEFVDEIRECTIRLMTVLGESTYDISYIDIRRQRDDFTRGMKACDFNAISARPSEQVLSRSEKFQLDHRNKSIATVASFLSDVGFLAGADIMDLARKILELKAEEHRFFTLENSFYVCKIGSGNTWTGVAPGALEVIPGERPSVSLENIWGSGFDDIRDYIAGMETADEWADLFRATSPSMSTDKRNILLVGPQGCGKTEVLRAVASGQDSVSIFAVGSDFMTCWYGEAQKNPKRLFQQALSLRKTTKRPIHILIDEVDAVLSDDNRGSTKIDLSLEFQNLMDGVVAYPGITIWGATNHPDRIPPPMLRRFAKVMIVGEMSESDRETTLKHYIGKFLPCENLDKHYPRWAKELEGATGDVVRKVADGVWLSLLREFVKRTPEAAKKALESLQGTDRMVKFEPGSMTAAQRDDLKKQIGETIKVKSTDVDREMKRVLGNFAIKDQIKVAKKTYDIARLISEE